MNIRSRSSESILEAQPSRSGGVTMLSRNNDRPYTHQVRFVSKKFSIIG